MKCRSGALLSVGNPGREAFHLVNLGLGESADDIGCVRDVLPRPVAHAVMVSDRRRIWLISAAASRRSARSGDSATMRSQARSRAASSGQRATATQLNQCSTKYRAGNKLYSSRARAVAAVQSASNLAKAPGSRRATAARIAAGSRSGNGTTGCSPEMGRWLMKPMLTHPSDSRQASAGARPVDRQGSPWKAQASWRPSGNLVTGASDLNRGSDRKAGEAEELTWAPGFQTPAEEEDVG
jgi:hypothetical protein